MVLKFAPLRPSYRVDKLCASAYSPAYLNVNRLNRVPPNFLEFCFEVTSCKILGASFHTWSAFCWLSPRSLGILELVTLSASILLLTMWVIRYEWGKLKGEEISVWGTWWMVVFSTEIENTKRITLMWGFSPWSYIGDCKFSVIHELWVLLTTTLNCTTWTIPCGWCLYPSWCLPYVLL